MFIIFVSCTCIVTYFLVEWLDISNLSSVQIPFNLPPPTTTFNISLYINFPLIDNYGAIIVAHLSVLSSYSGVSIPVNNTILPVVTLTRPDGSEGITAVIPLIREFLYLDQCYDSFQNLNLTYFSVQVHVHSPPMYTQLGEYEFLISLFLYSPQSSALNSILRNDAYGSYTFTVNIVSSGKPCTVLLNATIYNYSNIPLS